MKRIPLFDLTVTDAAKLHVNRVLNSGWLSTGSVAERFEREVASLTGVRHAIGVNSATAGLEALLLACDFPRGGEVITTPLTMIATIESIIHAGLTPRLADIDPVALLINPESVTKMITSRTVAIMTVDLAGEPCDYPALRKLCRKRNIMLLADAAHSFGALLNGKSVPQLASAAVFSFYSTKNLSCGEGGMVLTNDRRLAHRVRLISRHGMSTNAFQRGKARKVGYDVTAVGIKANLSDLHAAVGLGQLDRFERDQISRHRIAERYQERLAPLSELVELPIERSGALASRHLYICRLNLEKLSITRDQVITLMSKHEIECGIHYTPVHRFSAYQTLFARQVRHLPVTEQMADRIISLPIFPGLALRSVDRVAATLSGILLRHRLTTC